VGGSRERIGTHGEREDGPGRDEEKRREGRRDKRQEAVGPGKAERKQKEDGERRGKVAQHD
jgi:hypothetical protein